MLGMVCSYGNAIDRTLCVEGVVEKLADFNEQWALQACQSVSQEQRVICVAAAKEKMYRLDKPTMKYYRTGIQPSHEMGMRWESINSEGN